MFFTHAVPPALAPQVELLWYSQRYSAPHAWERVLPSGRGQLVIELAEASAPPEFERLRTEVALIETARMSNVMGVVMRPGSQLFSPVVELHALRERLQNAPSATAKFAILIAELEQRKHSRPYIPPFSACSRAEPPLKPASAAVGSPNSSSSKSASPPKLTPDFNASSEASNKSPPAIAANGPTSPPTSASLTKPTSPTNSAA